MRVLSRTGRLRTRRRGPRGAAFIWFLLVAMPFLMLAMSFAADFTRIVMTNHAMNNATAAAAAAGAWQFAPDEVFLDPEAAAPVVEETLCRATRDIAGHAPDTSRGRLVTCSDGRQLSVQVDWTDYTDSLNGEAAGPAGLRVNVYFAATDMLFFGYFGGAAPTFTATESAAVCVPGDTENYTEGWCVRPTG